MMTFELGFKKWVGVVRQVRKEGKLLSHKGNSPIYDTLNKLFKSEKACP